MKKGITNKEAAYMVRRRLEFETGNKTMFGVWRTYNTGTPREEDLYIVFSYGNHFPMWIWSSETQQWYGNRDKYSVTTSKHQTMTRPDGAIEWRDTDELRELGRDGVIGSTVRRLEQAQQPTVFQGTYLMRQEWLTR